MIGALITWGLCILSFLAGFILCSMFRIGRLDDVERTEATDASKPTTETPATDDYIDWSKVPDGYDWVAVDDQPCGGLTAWAWNKKPKIKMGSMYKDWQNGGSLNLVDDAIIGPLPPWRESLRHRPTTESTPS